MTYFLDFNLIGIVLQFLAWGLIAFLFINIYKKGEQKPAFWKTVVIFFIGLFSFTLGFTFFGTPIKLPILPLGVWLVCWLLGRRGSWQFYRKFAWLGFWANFIFLTATLLINPLHNTFYPKDNVSTYISSLENSTISATYPTANKVSLDKSKLTSQMSDMIVKRFDSIAWHREASLPDGSEKAERFPYYLVGTEPSFGSGLHTMVFIEKDGKGLLISSDGKQYYFRTEQSFLKGKGMEQ